MNPRSLLPRRPRSALARIARGRIARRVRGGASGPRELYLDLLEKAITHTLYFPPDVEAMPADVSDPFGREFTDEDLDELRSRNNVERREEGRDWPRYAQTMVGLKRTRNVRRCVESVLADDVPGDLIEAGCWRGGIAIMMRGVLKAHGVTNRTVWAADSFAGLPEPDPERYPADAADVNYKVDQLSVPIEQVRQNFVRYGLLDHQVRFLEGWFRETLPTVRDHRWAVVRLDGDLYESTIDGLTNLYPGLSPGGYLIVDDYGWDNCRAAVEDYRREHGINEPIERIDWVGAYWRKRG
jgi:O-methyltransferase